MVSGFLSPEQKNLHTNKLLEVSNTDETINDSLSKYDEMRLDYNSENDKTADYVGYALVALLLLFLIIFFSTLDKRSPNYYGAVFMVFIIIIIGTLIGLLLVYLFVRQEIFKSESSNYKTMDQSKKEALKEKE